MTRRPSRIGAQLGEMLSAMRTVSSKINSFESSLGTVKTKLATLESKVALNEPAKVAGRACLICGLTGHKFEDCPDKPDGYEPPQWYQDFMAKKKAGK